VLIVCWDVPDGIDNDSLDKMRPEASEIFKSASNVLIEVSVNIDSWWALTGFGIIAYELISFISLTPTPFPALKV